MGMWIRNSARLLRSAVKICPLSSRSCRDLTRIRMFYSSFIGYLNCFTSPKMHRFGTAWYCLSCGCQFAHRRNLGHRLDYWLWHPACTRPKPKANPTKRTHSLFVILKNCSLIKISQFLICNEKFHSIPLGQNVCEKFAASSRRHLCCCSLLE